MVKRWLIYLAVALTALVVYWAYQQWLAWVMLVGIFCLPVVSLLLSLPAMLRCRLSVSSLRWMTLGARERATLQGNCPWPLPPVTGKIAVSRVTTGEKFLLKSGSFLPADHCGVLLCKPHRGRVYDYLGLFFLKIRQVQTHPVTVYPTAVEVHCLPRLQRYLSAAWHPKPGGGFAENHELRLYRPGDSLNQIHWKLSAKTGDLIIREAMLPLNSRVRLTMVLSGTPEELDRKFGRLLWLSAALLERELSHTISVLTGKGLIHLQVTDKQSMEKAMGWLLAQPPAGAEEDLPHLTAAWQYRIGGGEDEE